MYKKLLLLFILSLCYPQQALPQIGTGDYGIRFSGFVMANVAYDSRQTVNAREGDLILYPTNVTPDIQGNDIYDQPSFNILSLFSRLSGNIAGPDAFGAKTSGKLEGDFWGQTNDDLNGFRLRHAFVKLQWNRTSILLGQTWSPLFVGGVTPGVIAVSAGAPFQPFSRNPQIRIDHEVAGLKITAAALTQRDFKSDGPQGANSGYLRNSALPDLHLQVQIPFHAAIFGVGGQVKSLSPQLSTPTGYKSEEEITTYTGVAYMKVSADRFTFKAEGLYGGNLSDHLMLGGYAVSGTDAITGQDSYTAVNIVSAWADLSVGSKVQGGLFLGFTENKGAGEDITGTFYGRGANIHSVTRIAPRILAQYGQTKLALETEITTAQYGTPGQQGIVRNFEKVSNMRVLFASYYYF